MAFYLIKSRRGTLVAFLCAKIKEVIDMTLNILFLTVTIKKRNVSASDYIKAEKAKKHYEENRDRMLSVHRLF